MNIYLLSFQVRTEVLCTSGQDKNIDYNCKSYHKVDICRRPSDICFACCTKDRVRYSDLSGFLLVLASACMSSLCPSWCASQRFHLCAHLHLAETLHRWLVQRPDIGRERDLSSPSRILALGMQLVAAWQVFL